MVNLRPTAPDSDPSALVPKIAAGDRAAFAALYRQTSAKLFGVALRILGRRDLAEDVLQESFVAVWERATDFDPARGTAMAWLMTVVRHRAIDQLRRRAARGEGRSEPGEALLNLPAAETARADRSAEFRAIEHCLGELEPLARRAVLLAYAYGFTHEELTQRLAAPIGTVKSWIRRGLERLKRCLEG